MHPSADPLPQPRSSHKPPYQPPDVTHLNTSAAATAAGRKPKLKRKAVATAGAAAEASQQLPKDYMLVADSAVTMDGHDLGADKDETQTSPDGQDEGQQAKVGNDTFQSQPPLTPAAVVKKPTRCQKCYTCQHKQLKKQCLRNKVTSICMAFDCMAIL